MSPSLTRRGWATIVVVVVLVLVAARFGARSLNAVVMPMALAVVAAYIAAWRAHRPEPSRAVPEDGFVGDSGTVTLRFESDAPATGEVYDEVDSGLAATGNRAQTTVGARPVEYEITYVEQGSHSIGGLTVTVRDVLGLAERSFKYGLISELVAYPRVYDLAGATRTELEMLAGAGLDREREEFDSLREYQSGDSLRDVHWKTSAKQPHEDLVVKQFVAEDEVSDVMIAAESAIGRDDEMAEAVASLAVYLLDAGIRVGLAIPNGAIDPGAGADHRVELLELLALTGPGEPPIEERRKADVTVDARADEVAVTVGDFETTFSSLAGFDPQADREERARDRDTRAAVEDARSAGEAATAGVTP